MSFSSSVLCFNHFCFILDYFFDLFGTTCTKEYESIWLGQKTQ